MALEHFDVLIIGAGLSGIGAACHLQKYCPRKSYVILEQRARIGGTWDLFRYPGIRSDSDMLTMSYSFRNHGPAPKPFPPAKTSEIILSTPRASRAPIATFALNTPSLERLGPRKTRHGRSRPFKNSQTEPNKLLRSAATSSSVAPDTIAIPPATSQSFANLDQFAGPVIHPQAWPENLDYAGKRIVIIGSGATAVTLVPPLAKTAADVVMLQRSPTYVVAIPEQDQLANWLRENYRPTGPIASAAGKTFSWHFVFYQYAQLFPRAAKAGIIKRACTRRWACLRCRHPFQPALQPVAAASLPGTEWRSVQSHKIRPRPGSDRANQNLHAKRHPTGIG